MITEAAISILRFLPDEHCFSPCPTLRLVYTTIGNNGGQEEHVLHVDLEVNDNNDDEQQQQQQEHDSPSSSAWLPNEAVNSSLLPLEFVLPRPSPAWMNEYRRWNYFGQNGMGHPVFSTCRDLRDFNEKGRMLARRLAEELAAPLNSNDCEEVQVVTVNEFLDLYNLQVGDWAAWWHIRDLNYPGLIVPIQQLPVSFELKSRLMMWRSMLGCNIHLDNNQQHVQCFNRQGQALQQLILRELSGEENVITNDVNGQYGIGAIPIVDVRNDNKSTDGVMIFAKDSIDDEDEEDGYKTSATSNTSGEDSTILLLGSDELSIGSPDVLDTITAAPPVSEVKEEDDVDSVDQGIQAMSIEPVVEM